MHYKTLHKPWLGFFVAQAQLFLKRISASIISWLEDSYYLHSLSPLEIKRNLGGLEVYQKMLAKLDSWLKRSFNWNCLKCPEILNRVEMGNENFQHKKIFVK